MKLTIGVMGSSGGALSEDVRRKAFRLGKRLPSGRRSSSRAPARASPTSRSGERKPGTGWSSGSPPSSPLTSTGASTPRRSRGSTANLAVFFGLLIMTGGMFLSVLYAQLLADASPAAIGLLLAPCAGAAFAIAPAGGRLADKIGPRALAVAGLLALGASVAIPALWHPASAASLVLWSNLIAGAGIGLATPALIRASTESVPRERAGLGAGVYKTVNELGGVFGVVLVGTLLEARIVANALRQNPGHFLPQEFSLKTVTSLKVLEGHAMQKGLALQDLEGFHLALSEAVQRGFDQVFGLAALLAGVGVVAGLMLPRRLTPSSQPGTGRT